MLQAEVVGPGGGGVSSVQVRDPPPPPPSPLPPPPPCPLGPLSCQGSIATSHRYGGAEAPEFFFLFPLPTWQTLERGWEAPRLAHFVHFAPQHYP